MRRRSATRRLSWASLVALFGAGGAKLRRCSGRWRLREWRLRTKLTAVLVVPLVLAGILGTLRGTDLVHRAQGYAMLDRQAGFVQRLGRVVYVLQGERQQVAAMLATAGSTDRATLRPEVQAQIRRVNTAVTKLRTAELTDEAFGPLTDQAHPIVEEVYRAALSQLAGLAALRQATLGSNTTPSSAAAPSAAARSAAARSAVTAYSHLIVGLLSLDRSVLNGAPDLIGRHIDGIKALSAAKEQASWEHAVLLAGILTGGLSVQQQAALRAAEAQFDTAADEFSQALSPDQRELYFDTRAVLDRKRLLNAALDRAVRGAPLETVPGDWSSAAAGTVETMHQAITTLVSELRMDAQARGARAWRQAFREGAAVIALLLLAVGMLVVVARSLLHPLRTLRTAAFEVADRRLPQAVEEVLATDITPDQAKEKVDPVPVHSQEEVGQVARAFDTVQAEALRLATEQAQLCSSLKEVFLTLSGRSQRLLEQQRRLIEELRGAARDPELGSRLGQLERLAARIRRHSDHLLLLAGAPRRGAEDPVPVLDVLNNALAEIDEYQRVSVGSSPAAMVTPPVANDLVHLIAELLDNATSVTPQGTMVTLRGALTEDQGLLVEITDSGPGLSPDESQTINARLASAPETEASVSGQMGLFVVRELAAQHGLTVRLRQRLGEQGITATVVLPSSLVMVDFRALANGVPEVHLPLQVSVVDEARAADLFSPSSISPAALGVLTSQHSRPRTAQEEWRELFGHSEPQPEQPEQPEEVHEEIFEMVSAWFRERQSAPVSDPPLATASEWRSPLDDEWQAAQALRTRAEHELTRAGLPKREPRAHLVSGADGRVLPTPGPACLPRTPDAVRGQLARYQRGLRVGRHARVAPGEQLAWTELAQRLVDQRPCDHRPFEENQQ